jgi:hypothetical protein
MTNLPRYILTKIKKEGLFVIVLVRGYLGQFVIVSLETILVNLSLFFFLVRGYLGQFVIVSLEASMFLLYWGQIYH